MQPITESKSLLHCRMSVEQLRNHKEKVQNLFECLFCLCSIMTPGHTHLRWLDGKGEMSLKLLQGAGIEHKSQELLPRGWGGGSLKRMGQEWYLHDLG